VRFGVDRDGLAGLARVVEGFPKGVGGGLVVESGVSLERRVGRRHGAGSGSVV